MRLIVRKLLRSPQVLYRRRWGWLLGHRFLLLTHQGRRTGLPRCTVLEVVRWDPAGPSATVVAGLGYQADWLRNLTADGVAHIDTGRHSFDATCRRLTVGEAVDVLADYELRNRRVSPILRAALSRLVGWRYDGSAQARERLAAQLPLIELRQVTRPGTAAP